MIIILYFNNVTINGECKIGDNTFLGSRSVIVNNIKIGKDKFVKAGEIVKKDIL